MIILCIHSIANDRCQMGLSGSSNLINNDKKISHSVINKEKQDRINIQTTRNKRAIRGKQALSYVEFELAFDERLEFGFECLAPGENNLITNGETRSFNR